MFQLLLREVSGGLGLKEVVGLKASESEVTSESYQKELHSSTLKYSFVPLASGYFTNSQLQLSEDALKKLQVTEALIMSRSKTSAVQDKCHQFFKSFGSHANKSHLHFGGIYWYTSISKGLEQKAMDTVKSSSVKLLT